MNKAILKELPELIKANLITPETARQIELYYNANEEAAPNRVIVILGILGTLLAGLGIVLLIAHNWDEFGNRLKIIFAFLPLVIGQGLCFYTLLKRKESVLWKECSAVVLFFGVIACISLTSQIYHINGSLSDFLLTCLLLTVPLVYIMSSSVVSLLYIAGATWYACIIGYSFSFYSSHGRIPYLYLFMLLLLLPQYIRQYKRAGNFFHLHNWLLSVSLTITLGCFISAKSSDVWGFACYLSLFNVYYLLGISDFMKDNKLFANPFLIFGTIGTLILLLLGSFIFMWREFAERGSMSGSWSSLVGYITIAFLLVATWLFLNGWRKKEESQKDPVGLSAFIFILSLFLFHQTPRLGTFIINIWILIIAIYYIRKGSAENHLGILNFGLLIIALLAIFRFFDEEIPFVWRGLFFLTAGAGFFVANYLMIKKRKLIGQKNNY